VRLIGFSMDIKAAAGASIFLKPHDVQTQAPDNKTSKPASAGGGAIDMY
jgi:hypothetical protein